METQKGNVTMMVLIAVVVVITAGVIGRMFAEQSQTPVQQAVVTQPAPVVTMQPAATLSDWKTYTSNAFNASISLPSDWRLVLPGDGSLTEPTENIFDGNLKYGFLASFSSPDKQEMVTFINGPLNTGSHKCEVGYLHVNNQVIREVTCFDTAPNEIPGRYNYAFDVKNLVLSTDKKTATTDKIITLIKFNEDSKKCIATNGKAGFILEGRDKCYSPGEIIPDTDCIVSSTGGCEPLGQ